MADYVEAGFKRFRVLLKRGLGEGKASFKASIFPNTTLRSSINSFIDRFEKKYDRIERAFSFMESGNFYPSSFSKGLLSSDSIESVFNFIEEVEKSADIVIGSGAGGKERVLEFYGFVIASYIMLMSNLYLTIAFPVSFIYNYLIKKYNGNEAEVTDEIIKEEIVRVWGEVPGRANLGVDMDILIRLKDSINLFGGDLESRFLWKKVSKTIVDPYDKTNTVTEDQVESVLDADLSLSESDMRLIRSVLIRMSKGLGSIERLV